MKFAYFASLTGILAATGALATACSTAPAGKDEPAESTAEDLSVSSFHVQGTLAYGDLSPATHYAAPRYSAFKFSGQAGDQVEIWVRSNDGDPVASIVDNKGKILATNDDASSTDLDSHIKLTLPASTSATHYVVVRDYGKLPMTFTVDLRGAGDFVGGCNVDADCTKVLKTCCDNLGWTAVRAGQASAYHGSLGCAASPVCPKVATRPDYGMAQCNAATHACELVQPKDIACGGFMAPAMQHQCPKGYQCRHDGGINPDVPGKCMQSCGGFANIACHDATEHCADDPSDSCDPLAGGADCPGLCRHTMIP